MKTKYEIHMNPHTDNIVYHASGGTDITTTLGSDQTVYRHLVFWYQGAEVGSLHWDQGEMQFRGNVDQSAAQLASLAGHELQTKQAEVAQLRLWLAQIITRLNTEQFEDHNVKAALDYLHKHEFFEDLIRGK